MGAHIAPEDLSPANELNVEKKGHKYVWGNYIK